MDEAQLDAWQYEQLVWALRWLAADADAAIAALDQRAAIADEIALSLGDVVKTGRGTRGLSPHIRAAVEEINEVFGAMSGPERPELWTTEAIRSDPMWGRQRERARDVLALLRENSADGDLGGHV